MKACCQPSTSRLSSLSSSFLTLSCLAFDLSRGDAFVTRSVGVTEVSLDSLWLKLDAGV